MSDSRKLSLSKEERGIKKNKFVKLEGRRNLQKITQQGEEVIDKAKQNLEFNVEKTEIAKAKKLRDLAEKRSVAARKREKAQRRLEERVDFIQAKISNRLLEIKQKANKQIIRQSAEERVNIGLKGIENRVGKIRVSLIGGDTTQGIVFDKLVKSAIEEEANKIIESDFFKSILGQMENSQIE